MDKIPEQCSFQHVIVKPSEIHFLRFVLEAYDGIASITTFDPKLGLVQINIAPGCEEEVALILEAEGESLQIRHIEFRASS